MNTKQKLFVDEYLTCWNATEAARRAGYSKTTASRQGYDLLHNPEIAKAVAERLEAAHMGAEEVLMRLASMARASLAPFVRVNEAGHIEFDFSQPEAMENLHLVKKIKTRTTTNKDGEVEQWVEVELYDAQAALQLVGKFHKLFTDVLQHEHNLNVQGLEPLLDIIYGTDDDSNTG